MKWEVKREPEMVPVNIDPMLYKAQLEEVSKILYKAFCQLDPRFKQSHFHTKPHSLNGNKNRERVSC